MPFPALPLAPGLRIVQPPVEFAFIAHVSDSVEHEIGETAASPTAPLLARYRLTPGALPTAARRADPFDHVLSQEECPGGP